MFEILRSEPVHNLRSARHTGRGGRGKGGVSHMNDQLFGLRILTRFQSVKPAIIAAKKGGETKKNNKQQKISLIKIIYLFSSETTTSSLTFISFKIVG